MSLDLFRISLKDFISLSIFAFLNSALTLAILKVINDGVAGSSDFQSLKSLAFPFIFFVIISYLLNIYFNKYVNNLVYDKVYNCELLLIKKILGIPLVKLEKLDKERIFTILEEIRSFLAFPAILLGILNSIAIVIMGFLFLITQSWKGSLIVIAVTGLLIAIYLISTKKLLKLLSILRNNNERFNLFVSDIFGAFKNFRIDITKRQNAENKFIKENRNESKELDIYLANRFNAVNVLNQYSIYLLIGLVIFLLPWLGVLTKSEIITFIFTLLFISAPVNRLLVQQNTLMRLKVSFLRIKELFTELSTINDLDDSNMIAAGDFGLNFLNIEFKDITFSHETFELGPINLSIDKGEVIFIIGGNGSGKSTFINLLSGLYKPKTGNILVNDIVTDGYSVSYQNNISAVFTDNYITRYNYDDYDLKSNIDYSNWLELFQMENIVKDDSESAARRSFSKGQSKRISLIFSLLEKKPLLILDEWAADQDPDFRKFFYEKIVPYLKSQGKTIIAISHDDKYFSAADRIIKFEEGKIVNNTKVSDLETSKLVI